MIRFDAITLFPEMFAAVTASGITRRALETGLWQLQTWNPRDFTTDNYRTIDDRPYGGGPGMVMLAEPLERALVAVRADRLQAAQPDAATLADGGSTSASAAVPVIHFSPTGLPLTQTLVRQIAAGEGAVLLCGRYEGIDQRFIDRRVTLEISLGDFVLSGGELPALALLDAVARLQPGVLTPESHQQDSFSADGLLDCPHYSRPEVLVTPEGSLPVPPMLLSGHHAQINRWRRDQSLRLTAARRPDLIAAARAAGQLSALDEKTLQGASTLAKANGTL